MSTPAQRNYDLEAKDHPEHRYAYAFDYRMHAYLLQTLAPYLDANGPTLELGCFEGHFTRLLEERFAAVDVVEASADCIEVARQGCTAGTRFHHARFESFEPSRQYANIFLVHTLEHLDDPVGVLRRIGTWLLPHGRLFVATPNAHAASRQIAVQMGLIEHATAVTAAEAAHGHRKTYSLDTLGAEVRAAGLSVESRGGVCFKGLANFQMDAALDAGIITPAYLDGCYALGQLYPDLCASVYTVCRAG